MTEEESREIAAILNLHGDAMLTSKETAIFLRSSTSSLERMRMDGTGPRYTKLKRGDASGANSACRYQKKDLLEWIDAGKVGSIKESIIRQGQV